MLVVEVQRVAPEAPDVFLGLVRRDDQPPLGPALGSARKVDGYLGCLLPMTTKVAAESWTMGPAVVRYLRYVS